MPNINWMDVSQLSFNHLLLLEQVQISWLPGWLPKKELAIALAANPIVAWYFCQKHPPSAAWLDEIMSLAEAGEIHDPETVRQAEVTVLKSMVDFMVYATDPAIYDRQPFLKWDSNELTSVVDFQDKTVIDVGAGTGRLALVAAPLAKVIYAVEPVGNLRRYLKEKARRQGFGNVYAVDGLITDIPFSDGFADVVMGGHVFGDDPEAEFREMARVTRPGGRVVLCPGNNDRDDAVHAFLVEHGFAWSRFEEPQDGIKRKYWKEV